VKNECKFLVYDWFCCAGEPSNGTCVYKSGCRTSCSLFEPVETKQVEPEKVGTINNKKEERFYTIFKDGEGFLRACERLANKTTLHWLCGYTRTHIASLGGTLYLCVDNGYVYPSNIGTEMSNSDFIEEATMLFQKVEPENERTGLDEQILQEVKEPMCKHLVDDWGCALDIHRGECSYKPEYRDMCRHHEPVDNQPEDVYKALQEECDTLKRENAELKQQVQYCPACFRRGLQ
jgi:hypothetical protein